MADHLRNQIRDRVATQLSGLTTTGTNIYQTPVVTPEDQTLPGLAIYITNEVTGETATMGHIDRECELHIDGYVEAALTHIEGSVDAFEKTLLHDFRGADLDHLHHMIKYISDQTPLILQSQSPSK